MTRLAAALTLLVLPAPAFPWGTWVKEIRPVPAPESGVVTFHLLKAGIFSREGRLKRLVTGARWKEACAGKPVEAWVTHRLSAGEVLTEAAGRRLGGELAAYLGPTCARAVELDVEPLPRPPDWLVPFLAAVKGALPKPFTLRLAVPPVSDEPVPGLHWKAADAARVAEAVDGLDFMNYDTGVTTASAYGKVLASGLAFLGGAAGEKSWVFGLPAYGDRTKRHRKEVENLAVARAFFEGLGPEARKPLCGGRVRLAFYAGWTAEAADWLEARRIGKWLDESCR